MEMNQKAGVIGLVGLDGLGQAERLMDGAIGVNIAEPVSDA